ncbi:MAG: histidine phosphatase family protein [Acidimicrobiales bacterium]
MGGTRMLLARHGESEWNAVGRWQGQADPPLSALGRHQAKVAAGSLRNIDTVFSSPLMRAAETAEIIAGELGVGPVVFDPGLVERDAGEWSGLTRAEIEQGWPGYLDPPADAHAGFAPADGERTLERRRPPGWEPDDRFLARALRALERIAAEAPGGDVLVVTHGGLVYVVEGHLGAPFARVANLAGRWVERDDAGAVRLGDRVMLIDPHDVPVTTPEYL